VTVAKGLTLLKCDTCDALAIALGPLKDEVVDVDEVPLCEAAHELAHVTLGFAHVIIGFAHVTLGFALFTFALMDGEGVLDGKGALAKPVNVNIVLAGRDVSMSLFGCDKVVLDTTLGTKLVFTNVLFRDTVLVFPSGLVHETSLELVRETLLGLVRETSLWLVLESTILLTTVLSHVICDSLLEPVAVFLPDTTLLTTVLSLE